MNSETEFIEALVGFARNLAQGADVDGLLRELVRRAPAALGVDAAGVSLIDRGRLRVAAAGDASVAELERVEEERQEGPCLAAMQASRPVLLEDLRSAADRWPAYVAAGSARGIAAVAALPMHNAEDIGALCLYDQRPRPWPADGVVLAAVLADIATGYVIALREMDRRGRTVDQLQRALDSRVVIEQAKGIVAARRNLPVDEAFAVLRRYANDHNLTLQWVADAVVNRGLRP